MDKTGLAMEAAQIFTEKDGVSAISRTIGAVKITDVKIRAGCFGAHFRGFHGVNDKIAV